MKQRIRLNPAQLPTRRVENWKYTDLARHFARPDAQSFLLSPGDASDHAAIDALLSTSQYKPDDNRLVFVDGQFSAEHSSAKLSLEPLPDAHTGLAAQMLWQPGAAAHRIELHADSKTPLHLVFVYRRDDAYLHQTQLEISLGSNQQLALIEEHLGGDAGLALNSCRYRLAENSQLKLTRLQHADPAFSLIQEQQSTLASGASLQQTHIEWGSRLSRLDAKISLNGHNASCDYHALSGLTGHQQVDHQTVIEHQSPQARSHIRARGIVDGQGRNIFSGKILVARDAQGTDSDQLLRNLLLSDKAEVDAKPELEIYADDVRCAHGSTVGRLDDNALFYLRSRGLDHSHARRLLMLSFAESVLRQITNEELHHRVQHDFADHLHLRSPT